MDTIYYSDMFQQAAGQVDKELLSRKQMEIKAGVWLNSVALKLQKKSWINPSQEMFQSGSSVFFSVWINDAAIKESKLLYNIHALKLKQLSAYAITSRDFATAFRKSFANFIHQWPHVSVDYGPQTLMEGWIPFHPESFQHEVVALANRFLEIDYLIDDLLELYKR